MTVLRCGGQKTGGDWAGSRPSFIYIHGTVYVQRASRARRSDTDISAASTHFYPLVEMVMEKFRKVAVPLPETAPAVG